MPQIINTNIASLTAQRHLNSSQNANSTALERLSSGLRINAAKDDAAGLAISTKFESQIKGLNVAIRNAGDGVSLTQTAEGALGTMTENLQRMRELAVQSSNSTNSDSDRVALQAEVAQLMLEVQRTSEETNFNGRNLLDGSFKGTFQIGSNAGNTVGIDIAELTIDRLGSSAQSGLSAIGTSSALTNGDLTINGVAINASTESDDNASTDNAAASAIAKVASINRHTDETGVSAFVNNNVAAGSIMAPVTAGSAVLSLNGVDIDIATSADAAQTRASVLEAVNAVSVQTGVIAVDTGSAATGLNLVAQDGRNIQMSVDSSLMTNLDETTFAAATGLNANFAQVGATSVYTNTTEGGFTLVANGDTKTIAVGGGNGTGRGDLANAGLVGGTYDRATAIAVSSDQTEAVAAASIAGGSLENTIARTDSGTTAITVGGTKTNLAGAAVATEIILASELELTVAVGDYSFAIDNVANESVSELAGRLDGAAATAVGTSAAALALVDFAEKIEFTVDVGTIATAAGGGTWTLGGVALAIGDTATSYGDEEKEAQAVSLMEQINAADFSATVGGTGSVVAELNADRDTVSITIMNQTNVPIVSATDLSTTSIPTNLDGSGGSLNIINVDLTLGGSLVYEATGADDVTVNLNTALAGDEWSTAANAVSTTIGTTNAALATTSEVDIAVQISGIAVSGISPLATGSTVADAAVALNAIDGVSAWEEMALSITTNGFDAGDTLTIGDVDVLISADETGAVTLATLADDINSTDFSTSVLGLTFDASAVLDSAGTSLALTTRNYGTASLTIQSNDSEGRGITTAVGFIGEQPQTMSGAVKFISDDGRDVSVTMSDPTTGSELFTGTSLTANFSGVDGMADGDMLINGVTIGGADTAVDTASATFSSDGMRILSSEKGKSAIAIANALNEVSIETGVEASVNATQVVGGSVDAPVLTGFEVGDEAGIFINGVSVGTVTLQATDAGAIDTDRARSDALGLVNEASGRTGVVAQDNGVSLTMTAADGRNISIAIDDRAGSANSFGALMGMDSSVAGIGEATFGTGAIAVGVTSAEAATYETTYGTVSLSSAHSFVLAGGENGNAQLESLGLAAGTFGGGADGTFLKDVDISTFEGAQAAITALDNALDSISAQRSELGAMQNRFESTSANLQVTSENLSASNSRIRDADFATETAELSRTQVLQQAGISILAQANQRPQQVLSLLG